MGLKSRSERVALAACEEEPRSFCRAGGSARAAVETGRSSVAGYSVALQASGRIVNLDPEMFKEVSTSDELWIVSSFTPWCLRCPDYIAYLEAVAQELPDNGPVHFGALNCHVNRKFCADMGLIGHPMVGLIYGGTQGRSMAKPSLSKLWLSAPGTAR